jgi:hypothetical protein
VVDSQGRILSAFNDVSITQTFAFSITPDAIELGNDGVVYLLSSENFNIFRWSTETRAYLVSIPLGGPEADRD